MNRSEQYANKELAKETKRKQKNRYYGKTAFIPGGGRFWTPYEEELVLKHEVTDHELSKMIFRSVSAIQRKRSLLKQELRVS